VFDCDGVLVDSEPHSRAAWMAVLAGCQHPASIADVDACTGLGFLPTHASLDAIHPLPLPVDLWPLILDALARSFSGGLRVFPDAARLLEVSADAGWGLAVASASPRSRLDLTLRTAMLESCFEVSVAGDEVATAKPEPDVYLAALQALGVPASRSVAIEDSVAGVSAALAAGMTVFGVAREPGSRDALEATGVRVVDRLTPALVGLTSP